MIDYDEPRIVAEGRWSQDEFGDVTYTPEHLRPVFREPEPDESGPLGPPEARSGYRIRSDETWAEARAAYLSGESAPTVCARYGLNENTLRARQAREGWRRSDIADPEPVDLEVETADGLPDLDEMARHALVRLDRAVRRGRSAEAAAWLRAWRTLTDPSLASSMLRLANKAPSATPSAPAAEDPAGPAAGEIRPAVPAGLEALGAISQDSQDSDPVFSAGGAQARVRDSGAP
jgi:hypothetical protein